MYQAFFLSHFVQHLGRLGELLIVGDNECVKLLVEALYLLNTVTLLTNALHGLTTLFPGDYFNSFFLGRNFLPLTINHLELFVLDGRTRLRRNVTNDVFYSTVTELNTIELLGDLGTQVPGNPVANVVGVLNNSTV